jgi:hypothetical protein
MDLENTLNFSDQKTLEKYSSALTLSDMEIFIFPELFFPLVLSNIMSPVIWEWREDPWFEDIEKKSFTVKANRIKQFIIQNYVFNLDLATWGLTSKGTEIGRFSNFFDIEMLRQSNALFGYEGDKYYFDIDIRKHFGLDKYDGDIIPYWKTETVEAMGAFRFKEGFHTGAGECVSLSALYAAAMFIVGRIPLEKIFLIATPLHSQNFILEKDGLITNNRRIVTKNMWFNGTSLSEKARRAMENEKITIVSHISGYIHTVYDEATIDRESYSMFSGKLKEFLSTDVTSSIFINFLRFKSKYKSLFQYKCECDGMKRYISLEKMFEYEHTSRYNASPETRPSLVKEIEGDDFHLSPIEWKILLNDIEAILDSKPVRSLSEIEQEFIAKTGTEFESVISQMFKELKDFIYTEPKLPAYDKTYKASGRLKISTNDSREDIIRTIRESRGTSETALLATYIYRQMDETDWRPFIKAAIERNPVCFTDLYEKTNYEVYSALKALPIESIYDGNRLALPDEVWNFKRGDGVEKAFLLADFIHHKDRSVPVTIDIDNENVLLSAGTHEFHFISVKKLKAKVRIEGNKYSVDQM